MAFAYTNDQIEGAPFRLRAASQCGGAVTSAKCPFQQPAALGAWDVGGHARAILVTIL